jgi:hypothetical protein
MVNYVHLDIVIKMEGESDFGTDKYFPRQLLPYSFPIYSVLLYVFKNITDYLFINDHVFQANN